MSQHDNKPSWMTCHKQQLLQWHLHVDYKHTHVRWSQWSFLFPLLSLSLSLSLSISVIHGKKMELISCQRSMQLRCYRNTNRLHHVLEERVTDVILQFVCRYVLYSISDDEIVLKIESMETQTGIEVKTQPIKKRWRTQIHVEWWSQWSATLVVLQDSIQQENCHTSSQKSDQAAQEGDRRGLASARTFDIVYFNATSLLIVLHWTMWHVTSHTFHVQCPTSWRPLIKHQVSIYGTRWICILIAPGPMRQLYAPSLPSAAYKLL